MSQPAGIYRHTPVTPPESMRDELAALLLQRARITGVIGVVVHVIFAVTDWIQFGDALVSVRLLTVLIFALLVAASFTAFGIRHISALVVTGFLVACTSLALIIWHRDMFLSGWAAGFFEIILAFCVFIPLATKPAAIICVLGLMLCLAPAFARYGLALPPEFATFFALLIGATIVVLVGRHTANVLWENEFHARQQLRDTVRELQETQQQLIQSEKMAALGRLVAGVAHELNNSLSVIRSNLYPLARAADTLAKDVNPAEDTAAGAAREAITQSVALLNRGVERASAITQHLRQYATPSLSQYSLIDLNEVLDLSVTLLATKARGRNVTIHREAGGALPATCDPQSLSQVLVNILDNACDAVPEGGNIWVRTRTLTGAAARAALPATDACTVITISDDGGGILPAHFARLFEPFFTTKPPGAGMGLGLAISRRIVEDHKGALEASNGPLGASFSITLPASAEPASPKLQIANPLEQPTIRNA
jgi:signal transduction histidine kinase